MWESIASNSCPGRSKALLGAAWFSAEPDLAFSNSWYTPTSTECCPSEVLCARSTSLENHVRFAWLLNSGAIIDLQLEFMFCPKEVEEVKEVSERSEEEVKKTPQCE